MARSHRGAEVASAVLVLVVLVDCSARLRSWVHSEGLRKWSMMAAKWSSYAGIGGVVCWKSSGWRVAFWGGSLRKEGGIEDAIMIVLL